MLTIPTLIALFTTTALAAEPVTTTSETEVEPEAPKPKPFQKRSRFQQRSWAISLSGGIATEATVEITAELNLPDQHSLALLAGVGSFQSFGTGVFEQLHVDVGVQYRYTVLGDFDTGVYVALEPLVQLFPRQVGVPWQVRVSPLAGVKFTAPFGLMVEGSAGPSLLVGNFGAPRAAATINVQVGYAFGKKLFK